jgi:hypothetical protein
VDVKALLLVVESPRLDGHTRRDAVVVGGVIGRPSTPTMTPTSALVAISELIDARVFDDEAAAHAAAKRINNGR